MATERIGKFPFTVGAVVRVFANGGSQSLVMMQLSEAKRFKLIGTDDEEQGWEVTWVSDSNQHLYKRKAGGRELVARYVRVVEAETEVD